MTTDEQPGTEQVPAEGDPILPSFPQRVLQVFFSPGALTEALARKPAWGAALLLGVVLMIAQTALIPAEVWQEMFRETLVRQGQEIPAGFGGGGTFMRVSAVIGGGIGYLLMAFLLAGVVTLIFAFVMGDEGKYRQYLAMIAHAWLISALVGLALVPLKIAQGNPQFTLNLGSFFFFLPEGYLLKVLTMLDLSQLWGWLVVAQGAHAIDGRRSFGSAAAILLALAIGMVMLFAIWAPMPG